MTTSRSDLCHLAAMDEIQNAIQAAELDYGLSLQDALIAAGTAILVHATERGVMRQELLDWLQTLPLGSTTLKGEVRLS